MKNFYDPKFVEELFDDMSKTYSFMNYVTSFGFSERWRKQFVKDFHPKEGETVVDLMTGMGECWKHILKESTNTNLIAIDFSNEMVRKAMSSVTKFVGNSIDLRKEDVLKNSIQSSSADYVISGFGMKTFNEEQLNLLAIEIERILKPGGKFSLVDVSVPKFPLLRVFYLFYLKKVIPILGRFFLGNPETYRMLGIYTEAFGDSQKALTIFKKFNFEVKYKEYFFGCASGIQGARL